MYWSEKETHFGFEPEYGYFHASDPWVLRHDMQMLANADVDFLFIDLFFRFFFGCHQFEIIELDFDNFVGLVFKHIDDRIRELLAAELGRRGTRQGARVQSPRM